jgi:hypothetical protein
MDDRMSEIAELYARILQLEILRRTRPDRDDSGAISDHIQILRRRVQELKTSPLQAVGHSD